VSGEDRALAASQHRAAGASAPEPASRLGLSAASHSAGDVVERVVLGVINRARQAGESEEVLARWISSALRASGFEAGWRDIASAPKDGTEVMLWLVPADPEDKVRRPKRADSVWSGEVLWGWQKTFAEAPEWLGWVAADTKYKPTHWQPLPAPPTGHPDSGEPS
jgi:hypothetical protein